MPRQYRPHYALSAAAIAARIDKRACRNEWGSMRWLSSFAILVYLSLLCTPPALAVHDTRLSPLADTQLLALNPALLQHTLAPQDDPNDEPVAVVNSSMPQLPQAVFAGVAAAVTVVISFFYLPAHQPRAPPVLSFA
ncbi:hypothetical protein [Rheinheimera maricola]|uniref:Uncharacterized protein n=1 Tax=Rheinheimera maricola TaxID=2793282 RepID=A0ABS7X4E5_9GAMM|nr:hypothetical protein [Rheinheimera maricola]MBZ9610417.1 hypothetical protein [Rheinheimera maricola]